MTSWCARHTVTPPPYTVTAKLLYNFLTAFFFPLNRVIAKTRKVRSRITRDACIWKMHGETIKISSGCLQHQFDTRNLHTLSTKCVSLSVPPDLRNTQLYLPIQLWPVAPLNGCGLRSLCGTNWICSKERCFPVSMHSSCRLVAAVTRVRGRASQCRICGVENRSGPGFSPSPSVWLLSVSFPQRSALFRLNPLAPDFFF